MQVGKINNSNNIKFGSSYLPSTKECQNQEQTQNYSPITTLPAQFVDAKTPLSYKKIGEYEFLEGIKTHLYKLSNGQTVALTPKQGETKINTVINCGAINEPDNLRGISHYIEHNLFNGSKNINPKEFFEETEKMGADTNASTGLSSTNYYIATQINSPQSLNKTIELHSDMVQNPLFLQSQLDKEKPIVISEINKYADKAGNFATNRALIQLFQIQTTSDDLIAGSVANINNLKREDVVNYYNSNYTPDKMTTILTGDFEPDDAIKLIAKNFTKQLTPHSQKQAHVDLKPIQKSIRSDYSMQNTTVSRFTLALCGPENKNLKDIICTNMILSILTGSDHSKLKKNLEKFNSHISCGLETVGNKPESPQAILIEGNCDDNDTQNVLQTIYSTIFNFKNEDISSELESLKKNHIKSLLKISEKGNRINDYLSSKLTDFTPDEIKNIPNIVENISPNDLKETFDKYFNLNKVSISVVHPKQTNNNKISFKGSLKQEKLNLDEFKFVSLENNSQVYLKEDKSRLKSLHFSINSKIPANINPTLPKVLAEILKKGPNFESDEDYSKKLDKHGIDSTTVINANGIDISANALDEDINFALNNIVEILKYPKLSKEKFEEAKKQVKFDITSQTKTPVSYIGQVMFPNKKSAATQDEQLSALNELKLEDVIGFLQYLKENGSNYFIWNKKTIPHELKQLGNFKPVNNTEHLSYQPLKETVIKTQIDNTKQAKISQTYNFIQNNSPKETINIAILNEILGGSMSSRLFTDLRETQKLAYTTNSTTSKNGNTGLLTMYIGTTTDNIEDKNASSQNVIKALDGFKKNTDKLKNEPVSKDELQKAKLVLKSKIISSLQTNSSKMSSLIGDVIDYNDAGYTNKILDEIENVTPESVQQTAQKVFAGNSLISIVASEKTLKETGFIN